MKGKFIMHIDSIYYSPFSVITFYPLKKINGLGDESNSVIFNGPLVIIQLIGYKSVFFFDTENH